MSDTGPTVVDGGGGTEVMHKEDSIEMQAKRLCTSIREAAAEHARQRDEVAADRQLLTDEKQRMEGVQSFPASRVKLSVGGTMFEVTIDTLCRVPGSMLESMFSGRHELNPTEDVSGAGLDPWSCGSSR